MAKGKSGKKAEDKEPVFYQKKTKWQSFKETLWNPDTKEFFGRSGKLWCLLFIFYIIYYTLLAGFFITALYVFFTTMITKEKPYLTGQQSLLRAVPGLAHQTRLSAESALLNIKAMNYDNNTKQYLTTMKELLKDYPDTPDNFTENMWDCDRHDPILNKAFNVSKDVCGFPLSLLKECQNYEKQLNQIQPCIIFKMNRIFGWLPSITNTSSAAKPLIKCKGQNPGDEDNLRKIKYYPEYKNPLTGETFGMFSTNYFPFLRQKNYLTPLVAVQLRNVEKHVLILMSCQLSGIEGEHEPVRLEFLID